MLSTLRFVALALEKGGVALTFRRGPKDPRHARILSLVLVDSRS